MTAGFVLGFMVFLSMGIMFKKLPMPLQVWLKRNKLIADLLVFVMTFVSIGALSKSIVAIFAATVAGLLVDFGFKSAEYLDENPDVHERLTKKYDNTVGKAENKLRNFIMS